MQQPPEDLGPVPVRDSIAIVVLALFIAVVALWANIIEHLFR